MKTFILFAGLLIFQFFNNDEVYHPELLNLFESDIVVDAYFKSQGKDKFYIIVNEVIKGYEFGIIKGDQINLAREDNGCGQIVDFSYYKRQRFYLIKTQKGWRLNYGSTQSIKSVYSFGHLKVEDRYCGLSFVPPHGKESETMNNTIREFVLNYRYDHKAQKYVPLVNHSVLNKLSSKNIIIAEFEKLGRCCIGGDEEIMIEPEPDMVESIQRKELPLVACQFLMEPAMYELSQEEFREFLHIRDYPFKESGIQGKVFVQIVVNNAGIVEMAEVKKGIHPKLDSIAIRKAYGMKDWIPGFDNRKRKRTCFTILPFTFKPSDYE